MLLHNMVIMNKMFTGLKINGRVSGRILKASYHGHFKSGGWGREDHFEINFIRNEKIKRL